MCGHVRIRLSMPRISLMLQLFLFFTRLISRVHVFLPDCKGSLSLWDMKVMELNSVCLEFPIHYLDTSLQLLGSNFQKRRFRSHGLKLTSMLNSISQQQYCEYPGSSSGIQDSHILIIVEYRPFQSHVTKCPSLQLKCPKNCRSCGKDVILRMN